MNVAISWLEDHPTTVGLLQWAALIAVAWFTGMFRWVRNLTRSPALKCVPTASFALLEELGEFDGHANVVRISFFLHASVVNRTTETIVIDQFKLGFACHTFWRSMRQRLLRLAYPSWPRKKLGEGHKLMGAYFTEYGNELDSTLSVSEVIPSRHIASGYLLFVSTTFGTWNPRIEDDTVKVRLFAIFSTGERRSSTVRIRVTQDKQAAEEFSPGILEHVAHESTWNHSL